MSICEQKKLHSRHPRRQAASEGGHPGDGCIPREDTRDAFGEEGGVSVTVSEHQQRTVGVYLRTPIIPEYLFISI